MIDDLYTNINIRLDLIHPHKPENRKHIDPHIIISDSACEIYEVGNCTAVIKLKDLITESLGNVLKDQLGGEGQIYEKEDAEKFIKKLNSFLEYLEEISKEIKEYFLKEVEDRASYE